MILGLDMSTKSSACSLFDGERLVEYKLWRIPDEITDWRERLLWMSDQLDKYIKTHKVDTIYCEDVPLMMSNPQTLKMLSALQGCVMGVVSASNLKVDFIPVSKWRSDLGLFKGSRDKMVRIEMKKSSIEYANKEFGLNLIWKSKSSKFNEDDLADAINVAYSQIKPKEKKQLNRKRK